MLPGDVRSVEDLKNLPFTNKTDLRDNYPFGMFTVPMSEIVRVHASSGTTGKPTVVGYTRNDLSMWAEVVTRSLCMSGVTRNDIVQVAYGYGLFTGGLGLHYGTENLGATVIPISGGNTKKQIQLMQDFGSTVIACTPSYALFLAEVMQEMGIDRDMINVNGGACALGHPIGASGARIIVTLLHALENRGLKRGVAAICIGGGEGTAIAIERP